MDVLVTQLVTSGGGWLLKRQKPGFNTQQGWKRRWVGIYDGQLFYSKKQTIPKLNSKDHDAKSMALVGLVIMTGSDGLTIRLHDPDDKNRNVDWKSGTQMIMNAWRPTNCRHVKPYPGTAEDREAWVHYMRSGIATSDRNQKSDNASTTASLRVSKKEHL